MRKCKLIPRVDLHSEPPSKEALEMCWRKSKRARIAAFLVSMLLFSIGVYLMVGGGGFVSVLVAILGASGMWFIAMTTVSLSYRDEWLHADDMSQDQLRVISTAAVGSDTPISKAYIRKVMEQGRPLTVHETLEIVDFSAKEPDVSKIEALRNMRADHAHPNN